MKIDVKSLLTAFKVIGDLNTAFQMLDPIDHEEARRCALATLNLTKTQWYLFGMAKSLADGEEVKEALVAAATGNVELPPMSEQEAADLAFFDRYLDASGSAEMKEARDRLANWLKNLPPISKDGEEEPN